MVTGGKVCPASSPSHQILSSLPNVFASSVSTKLLIKYNKLQAIIISNVISMILYWNDLLD